MALPKIQKKKTVNDLIKDYDSAKQSTSKIVSKSTTKSAPTNSYAQSFINKYSVQEPVNYEDQYLKLNSNTLANGGIVKVPTSTPTASNKVNTSVGGSTPTVGSASTGGTGSAGGSYSSAVTYDPSGMIDITNMLKAYEDAAAANKAIAEQSYSTRRNDLLTSLKRYQEQNAQDVAAQQKTYLANQALLESAIAEADRQNRINASARGLGGSGLQQLSQLQTLLSQGQTISDMASENQDIVNNLRKVLANYDEDTQTALSDLEKTKENTLRSIESELGTNKANLEYQAREKAADRAHAQKMAEASTAAQIAAQNAAYERQAAEDEKMLNSQLSVLSKNYENEMSKINSMSKSQLKDTYGTNNATAARQSVYDSYYDSLGTVLNNYGVGGTDKANSQYQNLLSVYNKYGGATGTNYGAGVGTPKSELEKRTSLWNWIVDPADYMDAKAELKGNNNFRLW